MKSNLIGMKNELTIIEHLPQTRKQAVQLLKVSPMQYWMSINPRTIQDVFNAPEVGIASIRMEIGEQRLQAMMVKWVNSFLDFYSTNGTMDAMQVAETINLIIDTYPHYTIYDFKLFFKLAKLGNYGEVYGRMDGSVILSWLRKYDVHRDTVAQSESIKEQEQYKELAKRKKSNGIYYSEYLKLKQKENDTSRI